VVQFPGTWRDVFGANKFVSLGLGNLVLRFQAAALSFFLPLGLSLTACLLALFFRTQGKGLMALGRRFAAE
jgi:hypothetical protein